MYYFFDKIISTSYFILLFAVPLILFPTTSELFEFNKMVATYILTVIIVGAWLAKMITQKKLLFRKSLLDLPLLAFLASQVLSTIVSIDRRTSLLGYYSRFHGGLASSISYALLYWAYVANIDRVKTLKAIKITLISALLVSAYGVLQHFGIDAHIWVQDVKNRIFSTLGQPNWLAAWIVALLPVTWTFVLEEGIKKREIGNKKIKIWSYITLSCLFSLTLLYTKSRSGLLGFGVSLFVFWFMTLLSYFKQKLSVATLSKPFLILNLSLIILILFTGTPWTPKLGQILVKSSPPATNHQKQIINSPSLEVGGSASTEIRKIVWKGAIDIWKNYPILGSGVETFAFSYYSFRPVEHNMVSEWDYLYNKAHNEYLNFAATTGTLGLFAYFVLIAAIIYQIAKAWNSRTSVSHFLLPTSLLAGFISILVTNFFGFSVVPVALLFFLYPAFASSLAKSNMPEEIRDIQTQRLNYGQKIGIIIIVFLIAYFLSFIYKYWYADLNYARGKSENDSGNPVAARETLNRAVKLSPNEAIFWDELSQATTDVAIGFAQQDNQETAAKLARSAVTESAKAVFLSPANVNIKRSRASSLVKLSAIDQAYLIASRDTLLDAVKLAPTDAKLTYNLSLTYLRLGDYDNAIKIMGKTVELRPIYRDAHYALALMYIDVGEKGKAKERLEYMLKNLNPNDEAVKKELEELK